MKRATVSGMRSRSRVADFLGGTLAPCVFAACLGWTFTPPFGIGCTPAERATAGTVAQDVAAVAGSPVPCATLSASGVKVGTACGTVSIVVSEVAQMVGTILAGLPPAAPGMRAAEAPVVAIVVRGVTVTLPAPMAEAVRAKIGDGA